MCAFPGSAEGGVSPRGLDSWVVQSLENLKCLHSKLSNFLLPDEQSAPLPLGTVIFLLGQGLTDKGMTGSPCPTYPFLILSGFYLFIYFLSAPFYECQEGLWGGLFPGCRHSKSSLQLVDQAFLFGEAATEKKKKAAVWSMDIWD